MVIFYWVMGMIGVVATIVLVIVAVTRGSWDKCTPPAVCKEPGRIRKVKRARLVGNWIEVNAIEYATWYKSQTRKTSDDLLCYGDDGMCGNYWGVSIRENVDGSGCEASVYKDGVRHELGKMENKLAAFAACIDMLADSTSAQDINTVEELKIWLEHEKNDS